MVLICGGRYDCGCVLRSSWFFVFVAGCWSQEVGGCRLFPADHIWNTRVDRLPVHPRSESWIATVGRDRTLRADFGAGLFDGAPIGIPFVVVPAGQARVPVTFEYADESDAGPYPIPVGAPIEGGAASTGDRHVLVVEGGACKLYEVYSSYPNADGSWKVGSGSIFDFLSYGLRPKEWTSADAAGLPILPGLVRYEEVAAGEIRHVLRFTVPQTQRAYLWPARHFASRLTDGKYPPMGAWFRLRGDFDVSKFSAETQVILRALQRYGMILADNGSSWYLSGAPDERWRNDRLRELLTVKGADLEAVDVSGLQMGPDSGRAFVYPDAVRNGASGEAGALAPGEIISIYGAGLGPRGGVVGTGDALPVELGGTRVLIGGKEAALLYVSEGQVNAIVPYGLAGAVPVVVRVGGADAMRVETTVGTAAPGVFVDGEGRAASWMSGDVVSFLMTGEGATTRPELYGRVVEGELPRVAGVVRVWIAGVEAEVLYAGGAPGMRTGVAQVNVRVPAGAGAGPQTVLVRVGDRVSGVVRAMVR
jgi:uncharacterized protein (TIGR03437 family)